MENNPDHTMPVAAAADLFRVRSHRDADLPFVYNSFLKSYRDSPTVAGIPNTVYYDGQHRVIERLLSAESVQLVVAHAPDDDNQIYGYVIAAPGTATVHWVYCKHPFRGYGIAKHLVQVVLQGIGPGLNYTHRVKGIDRLIKDRPAVYNPYLLVNK